MSEELLIFFMQMALLFSMVFTLDSVRSFFFKWKYAQTKTELVFSSFFGRVHRICYASFSSYCFYIFKEKFIHLNIQNSGIERALNVPKINVEWIYIFQQKYFQTYLRWRAVIEVFLTDFDFPHHMVKCVIYYWYNDIHFHLYLYL